MKRIASRDNPFYRTLRRWSGDAAARRTADVALLEGVHLADAYLRSGGVPRHVVVGRSALDDAEVAALLERLVADRTIVLDDGLFAGLSRLAQGVPLLLVVEPARPAPGRIERTSVVLDRVQDPGNVGSILRSAAAAGIGDVYLSSGCAGAWSPKVLRAAMGGHFHLRLFEDCDLGALLLRAAAVPWLATSPHAKTTVHETDLVGEVVWAFGHEGQGLAPGLLDGASAVRIPQPGHGESLNVAASAAICFFEQSRQRLARSTSAVHDDHRPRTR